MKKQVALLLAATMTIASLSVNAFAATNNYVDNRLTVPDGTAIMEHGTLSKYAGAGGGNIYLLPTPWSDGPDYYADGTDLVVPLQRSLSNGTYQFKLTLSNAKWFFKNNVDSKAGVDFTSNTDRQLYTYDYDKGKFEPSGDYSGLYTRTTSGSLILSGVNYVEVPYTLEVSSYSNNVATITLDGQTVMNAIGGAGGGLLRIPLVTYISDSNVEATVTIDPGNSSTVTAQKIIFANTASDKTNTTAASVKTGRDEISLDSIIVNELRVGTITGSDIVKLSLPAGWHFDLTAGAKVGVEKGLTWDGIHDGYGTNAKLLPADANGNVYVDQTTGNYYMYTATGYYSYDKLTGQGYSSASDDDSTLYINMFGVHQSDQLRGSIYIDGLVIWADDTAYMPAAGGSSDITMKVEGVGDPNHITSQSIVVAQRTDWSLGLKTLSTAPTLVSGRYIGASMAGNDADDNTHRTADVQLYEASNNSWWASRTTVLALPATDNNTVKGAKFRRVTVDDKSNIDDVSNLQGNFLSTMYGIYPGGGVYLNDGERHGCITVNDNTITLSNVKLTSTGSDTSSINFHLWVSLEYGFGAQTGDLVLAVDPSSTSLDSVTAANLPSVVIAHVVDPVTVTTTVSDLKIGYQYQTTSDIQIQENGAGYLLQNKTVKVSITDLISSDMYFTNDTKVAVTAGDLRIKNITATGQGGFASQSYSTLGSNDGSGTISFDIDRVSTIASTITISNVAVKLDRTVPVTNKNAYQVVVWGTAIAENYGLVVPTGYANAGMTWKSGFNTAGTYLPYINVISAPPDQTSILTQEVRVPIGENYYVVNGQTYSMDAVAYISPASNSTMIPVRFVGYAFGLRDDQILWDDANKTCTITAPNKVIQFKLNSSTMIVNGVPITMTSPDNLPVVAEIKTINGLGRLYLPFRALGNAFGVSVDWEADTQTAIYNKGANSNGAAAVTNTTPVTAS